MIGYSSLNAVMMASLPPNCFVTNWLLWLLFWLLIWLWQLRMDQNWQRERERERLKGIIFYRWIKSKSEEHEKEHEREEGSAGKCSQCFRINDENQSRSFSSNIFHFNLFPMCHVTKDRKYHESSKETGGRINCRGNQCITIHIIVELVVTGESK